jgi:nucleoid-associated protein YgaU
MSRDENRHENRNDNRDENNGDNAEEKAVGSSGLGREAKIGVTVIALLLVVLGGVVAWRMMGAGADDKVAAVPEAGKDKPAGESKTETMLKDTKSKLFGNNTATVVPPAKSASSKPPRAGGNDVDQWKMASDRDNGKRAGGSGSAMNSPPSFMPDPPKPPHADRHERYSMDPPTGQDRDANDTKPLRDGDSDVRLVAPGDEPPARLAHRGRDEASGFASVEPAPDPSRYRDQNDRRFDNTPPAPSHSDSRRSAGGDRFTPAVPVGQYGASDYRHEPAAPKHNGLAPRHAAAVPRSPAPQRNDGKYEVQPNDSYWTISEQVYGSGAYFKALAEHNRSKGKSEDQLQPGDLILAPAVAELEKSYPDLCPKASRREAVQSQSQNRASTVSTRRTGQTYTVAEGDTLFNIARYELGKASRWVEIYELNRDVLGKDFNYLTPGTQLAMPGGEKSDVIAQPPSSTYRR